MNAGYGDGTRRAKWDNDIPDESGSGKSDNSENKLFVGNLDRRVNEYMILKLFSKYGKVVREAFM
jgi:RNA recognition motif-containing protein